MNSYWLWFLLNIIVWPFAIGYYNYSIHELTLPLFGVTAYFLLFFLLPVVGKRHSLLVLLLYINTIIVTFTLFPYKGEFNPFLLLLLSILIAEGFYRLPFRYSVINGAIIMIELLLAVLYSNQILMEQAFVLLFISFLFMALLFYKKTNDRLTDLDARYQAILNEYRGLKRRGVSKEELARQEERVLIAHEIHDSVGHKLTALIMQLEMFRLQAKDDDKEKVATLKKLANESLNETRRAVKSLRATETGGLPGILRLLRKLEVENMMKIHFSVKHGAFSVPLTGEQAFVIYRSVQESLTNIMKHSKTKEAEIVFEAPGGSIFRFEITNPIGDSTGFQEGFGLSSMRERLEKHNGELKVYQTESQFFVSGYMKISNLGD
jgi:signal transduction histidine kinase